MLPTIFEWMWDPSHLVFMGGLWYALNILGIGMTYCIIKSVVDCTKENDGEGAHHH